MSGRELVAEILAGREVVAISPDKRTNSAIFYSARPGRVCVFGVEVGNIEHPNTPERIAAHFDKLRKEGSVLYLRGARRADA